MKIRKKYFSHLKKESGFISIETIFAMSFVIIVFTLCLGFFTFVQPYTQLDREVHVLAQLAQRQGGLTMDDVQFFKERVSAYSFVNLSDGLIQVDAHTIPDDRDVIGVTSLDEAGDEYVRRDEKELIQLVVTIPSHNDILKPVARFLGVSDVSDHYTFKEVFMSDRY
ncbi:hypothetical protein [Paenibacillus polymyxa]|uniref:Uncharacterized protein n=1 Tax=Paenibacillus polymyxa (strain SC2) TaxID=886882 RepID=E3EKD8_PAEPS|nr:hypothetical protein [Paenibacillus polymyxa]ADO59465.1 hypothetical protein PPSC2_27740 [Paenibacillus polymyxa SC2]WPQ59696.1 hypothetical protein SKN87_28980 [Paenibacillus polymyxa]